MGDHETTPLEWTTTVEDTWRKDNVADAAFAALVECYRSTPLVHGRGKVIDVRRDGDDALLDFAWDRDAETYTVRVGLPVDYHQQVDNGQVLDSNIFSYERGGRSAGPLEWVQQVGDFIDEALMTGATKATRWTQNREPLSSPSTTGRAWPLA